MQAGGQCLCGNTLNDERAPDSQCNWACDGGDHGGGGSWRNDVYMTEP